MSNTGISLREENKHFAKFNRKLKKTVHKLGGSMTPKQVNTFCRSYAIQNKNSFTDQGSKYFKKG